MLAALFLLLLAPAAPWAQTDPDDPPEEKYEPPPDAPRNDPGVDEDPLPAEDLSVLGQPLIEGTQELDIAVADVPLPDNFAALGPSQTPNPTTCDGYTGAVTPIQVSATYPHYFSYGAPATPQTTLLVGVSADAACHMDLVDKFGNLDPFKCRIGTYKAIFADLKARGLNKIRLWVALAGHANENPGHLLATTAREPANQPFEFVAQPIPNVSKSVNYYRFDKINRAYFESLRSVVREAKRNDLFVEVTFFAPFEGEGNPWVASNYQAGAPNPTSGLIEQVGFTDARWFVISNPPNAANARMQGFQKAIIDWTIDWLWCYDNVWWEIANEPEQNNIDPNRVIAWQQQMIAYSKASEARYLKTNATPSKPLQARHPIAVQPFHKAAAEFWRTPVPSNQLCKADPVTSYQGCRPDVINGHYTQVLTNSGTPFPLSSGTNKLEVGAIRLVREYSDPKKVFGLNEDNITPLGGEKGTRTFKTDVPSTTPDARQFGLPDPVRAEAWEFLLHGGGSFDHFGYSYTETNAQKVRDQLGRIRAYLTGLKVHELAASVPGAAGAGWADVGPYPTSASWDMDTLSRKHWGAMESRNFRTATSGRQFLLYMHRSTPRCKVNDDDFKRQDSGLLRCTGQNLSFDAYDGRRRPTARYQEADLVLHLGTQPGNFNYYWLDPTNPSAAPLAQGQIDWKPAPEFCRGRSPCKIASPKYPYDALLRIVQR